MSEAHARLKQTFLGGRLFYIEYRQRYFLVSTYPFRVAELEGPLQSNADLSVLRNMLGVENPEPALEQQTSSYACPDYESFGAVELIATTRCNLRCTHCAARSFDDSNSESYYYGLPAVDMSEDMMVEAMAEGVRQLAARLERRPSRSATFELFITGGEPLLVWARLRKAITQTRYALSRIKGVTEVNFNPHIVTNGTLITKTMARELTEHRTILTVALDSPYNQVRVDCKNEPATPRALLGLKELTAAGHPNTSINIVLPGELIDESDRIFAYLESQGAFEGISTIQLSPLAPPILHTQFAGADHSVRTSGYLDEAACLKFSEKLIEYSIRFGFDMKLYGAKLGAWLCQGGTMHRCPVAEWKWCADPLGNVFACHQLVGIPRFRMGNLRDNNWYESPESKCIRDMFLQRTVFRLEKCRSCVLGTSCMVFVDCPARSFLECGDIFKVVPHYCQCGKTYLEALFGEHILSLIDHGVPAAKPFFKASS